MFMNGSKPKWIDKNEIKPEREEPLRHIMIAVALNLSGKFGCWLINQHLYFPSNPGADEAGSER